MSKLLLATNNPGKLIEIQALLQDLEVQLLTPEQVGLNLEVVEDGQTYAENARLKGLAFVQASGLLTLADDSGLEVDALGGLPGIRSARFAPGASPTSKTSDAERRAYLLQRLQGLPRPWTARFRCVVALVKPGEPGQEVEIRFAEGQCHGEITPVERGLFGFGYDPIFFFPELGRTLAELSMEEKNQVSHRARAVMAARPELEEMLATFQR